MLGIAGGVPRNSRMLAANLYICTMLMAMISRPLLANSSSTSCRSAGKGKASKQTTANFSPTLITTLVWYTGVPLRRPSMVAVKAMGA